MRKLEDIRANTSKAEIFRGQAQHLMLAVLLTAGAISLLKADGGSLFWEYLAITLAVVHQIIVAIVFRLQLHLNTMVRVFGERALKVWATVFLPLLVARPVLLLIVGIFDYGSLSGSASFHMLVGIALILPAVWTLHSVLKYFTINRALGGDHFFDEYLNMPMVSKGAFKYSPNAMYTFVFTGLWGIAILLSSWNALVLALFYHAYIWVHMYCTEDPDMRILYAGDVPVDDIMADEVIEAEIIEEPEQEQS